MKKETIKSDKTDSKKAAGDNQKERFNQIAYQNEYTRQKYDRVSLTMKKGRKAEVKGAALACGKSLNEFINSAVDEVVDDLNGSTNDTPKYYMYGMRLRGFSIGCQPNDGFIDRIDDRTGRYHDIIIYNRKLSDEETEQYELDRIS